VFQDRQIIGSTVCTNWKMYINLRKILLDRDPFDRRFFLLIYANLHIGAFQYY